MRIDLGNIVAADLLQIVVIMVVITIFAYLRFACGGQARFLVHLALAYAGIGIFYVFDIGFNTFAYLTGQELPAAMVEVEVVSSTLSLMNTAFFFTAWYLMRDLRLEKATASENPVPTMSKPFVGAVIAGLMTSIAGYIAMTNLLAQNSKLRLLFVSSDAFLSTVALVCIGSEFLLIPLIRDAQEGSLFSETSHLIFRVFALLVFVLWGIAQWGRVIWIASDKKWMPVTPYTGQWHQWSAILKIVCGGTAGILALHALPSTRWKHKQIGKNAPPPNNGMHPTADTKVVK